MAALYARSAVAGRLSVGSASACYHPGMGTAKQELQSYRARWIVPVSGAPVENGVVEILAGKITRIRRSPQPGTVDLGDVAIIPGLVNPHTHLEFSTLVSPLTASSFAGWIPRVMAARLTDPAARRLAVQRGIDESIAAGTTLIGEISTDLAASIPIDCPIPIVAFAEAIGLSSPRIDEVTTAIANWLESPLADGISHGVSPHAPYSVHPDLFEHCCELAERSRCPLAMHIAESPEEIELLASGTGGIHDFLVGRNLWSDRLFPSRDRLNQWLEALCELPRAMLIHGNFLDRNALGTLARNPHVSLIYCPRTHASFGYPEHPWRDLLAAGGSVAIATDSRATNPDLSIWHELQFLAKQHPEVSHVELLELGTLAGATALGFRQVTGSLGIGKKANLAVVKLKPGFADLATELLTEGNEVVGTMVGGIWLQSPFG